ncbi:MAG: putative magnesium chelatase [Frankiales bacterium]|nr:putative magnesium chelatase [Frankiales bacterium]
MHELDLIRQEALLQWEGTPVVVPDHLLEVVARWTRLVRESPQVDQRSGVSARFAVAAAETIAASAVRRAAVTGEQAVARVCDLPAIVASSRGKVEFESAEEGRELEVLDHLLRKATADTFRATLAGLDLSGLQGRFDEGAVLETGDLVPAAQVLADLGTVPGLAQLLQRLGVEEESPGLAAAALEFAMEGLHLNRRLSKDSVGHRTVYGR